MKKVLFTVLFALLISFSACDSQDPVQEGANLFYREMQKGNVNGMLSVCDRKAFELTPREDWKAYFESHLKNHGKLQSRSRIGFSEKEVNSLMQHTLKFKTVYEQDTLYERLIFTKRPDGMKLLGYKASKDRETVENDE